MAPSRSLPDEGRAYRVPGAVWAREKGRLELRAEPRRQKYIVVFRSDCGWGR